MQHTSRPEQQAGSVTRTKQCSIVVRQGGCTDAVSDGAVIAA